MNIDASCRGQSNFIGMGCVVKDDRGEFMPARSVKVRGGVTPLEAEAWSLRVHCYGK